MTEKEAIETLKHINLSRVHPFYSWEEMAEVRDIAISALEEIQKYRALGTVEELWGAMEKQRAKKPKKIKPCKSVSYYSCPECGGLLGANQEYCEFCGQAIDWSDEE